MLTMNNSNKHKCSNDKFDRISSLPDEMLQQILSFLGIREAVQTSLVSKRWVNLWTSLSHLNFDPHEFVSVEEYRLSAEDKKRALDAKFKEFVETLLSRREKSFWDNFVIKILDQYNCSDLVRSCVSYAMFNPRVFSMESSCLYKDISACIFSCQSIEELCLRTSFKYSPQEIPEVVNLPCLRRSELRRAKLDTTFITNLFSGCPKLEELSLEHCFGEFSCIFSQKLKYLSVLYCFLYVCSGKFIFIRSIKSATDIRSAYQLGGLHSVWKFPCTISVSITFSFMQNLCHCLELGDYFGGLSDATVLELQCEDLSSILEVALPKFGAFNNLMDLCLGGWCMTCNFGPIVLFLQQTPNLEKITLYMSTRHCRGKEIGIHGMVDNLMRVELSRCKNLKWVDIKLLKGYIRAHKIDETLLPSRKVLENIEVVISQHI